MKPIIALLLFSLFVVPVEGQEITTRELIVYRDAGGRETTAWGWIGIDEPGLFESYRIPVTIFDLALADSFTFIDIGFMGYRNLVQVFRFRIPAEYLHAWRIEYRDSIVSLNLIYDMDGDGVFNLSDLGAYIAEHPDLPAEDLKAIMKYYTKQARYEADLRAPWPE